MPAPPSASSPRASGRGPALSRRGAVVAVPLTLALAGCRWGPEADGAGEPVSGTTPPPPDADRVLVDQATALIGDTAALVAAAVAARPRLGQQLAAFATLHDAHLRHLAATPVTTSAGEARALAGVLKAERRLQEGLIDLAGRAGSGILARSLASMAAGVAQHVAVASEGTR
ncbi:hypothetical protein [Nocardioides daejeonensis]|uniref:hypothetical protein n=1 Tax=Nocardioides daejeonensis TaxID=1046556 RepID=UPI0013A583C1|nr:hypothetical protein [Nocardioides daejeonensis]